MEYQYNLPDYREFYPDHISEIDILQEGSNAIRHYVYCKPLLKAKCLIEYFYDLSKTEGTAITLFINIFFVTQTESYRIVMYQKPQLPAPVEVARVIIDLADYVVKKIKLTSSLIEGFGRSCIAITGSNDERSSSGRQKRFLADTKDMEDILSVIAFRENSSN